MKPIHPKGWHSRGYLPHFDSPEAVQFVTFRLADSLPAHVTEGLRDRDHALPRLDNELDSGLGACWLRLPEIASLVEAALLHFDGERYRLLAWCVMPNHGYVENNPVKAGLVATAAEWAWSSARFRAS